jgi:hypothetical protein
MVRASSSFLRLLQAVEPQGFVSAHGVTCSSHDVTCIMAVAFAADVICTWFLLSVYC